MAVFLVTWDINQAKPNYAAARVKLIAHLQTYDHKRDPGLDSVWFVNTPKTASQVSAGLGAVLDTNDRWIVTQIVPGRHQGCLHPSVWTWINARLGVTV